MGVAVEDSGTSAVTYVLLKLDADFPSRLSVRCRANPGEGGTQLLCMRHSPFSFPFSGLL